jgi:hypothetical protein
MWIFFIAVSSVQRGAGRQFVISSAIKSIKSIKFSMSLQFKIENILGGQPMHNSIERWFLELYTDHLYSSVLWRLHGRKTLSKEKNHFQKLMTNIYHWMDQ